MVEPVVKVEALTKSFAQARGSLLAPRKRLHAVKDVSVDISRGEAFGIIGESGCGKSTLARMLVGLYTQSVEGCCRSSVVSVQLSKDALSSSDTSPATRSNAIARRAALPSKHWKCQAL